MNDKQRSYDNADAWRAAAMKRVSDISVAELRQRKKIADAHNLKEGINDADTLADQEIYIQGKMSLEEYQSYLLFKHSNA
ncbi:MAG: hypothetical protein Q9M12_06555 [Mariprofundus sp.]|nr:hypothetical protein [Mariprofundus sp.]